MRPLAAKDMEGADAGRVRREHSLSPHASISENTLPLVAARLACYLPQSGQKTSALDVAISPLGSPSPMFTCRSLWIRGGKTLTVISNRGGWLGVALTPLVFVAVF